MNPIAGRLIWKCPQPFNLNCKVSRPGHTRLEFPSVIHYRGHWYCGFRQADVHENHPSGRGVIIRSADGVKWDLVKVIAWDGADAGMPRFSITAEGVLMVNEWLQFVSREPRDDGYHYQLDRTTLGLGLTPHSDLEPDVASQSVTWFSEDGLNWGSAYACPSGVNTTRFQVVWHNGMAWSIANALGKNIGGTLYRSRDGKTWRTLLKNFMPLQQGDECGLAFATDDTLCCLLRGNRKTIAWLGVSAGPYYQQWKWIEPMVDWHGNGQTMPINQLMRAELGGPQMIRLSDGRLLGAGRTLPPERPDGPWRIDPSDTQGKEDGRIVLFTIDPKTGRFTRFAEMDGTSYPGVWEHDGFIWVTYLVHWGDEAGIYMAKLTMDGNPA